MWRSQLLALSLLLVPSACMLRTAPKVDVQIHVTRLDPPDTLTDATLIVHRVCRARLTALASGDGTATWMESMWRWYDPADTTVAVDSARIPPGTVQRVWGTPYIDASAPLRSEWQLGGHIPFVIKMEYRYMPQGGDGPSSTTVTLLCAEDPAA